MRKRHTLLCLPLLAMLSACGMPDDGYYDANGNYVPPANATTDAQRRWAGDPGKSRNYNDRNYDDVVIVPADRGDYVPYDFDRAGYYDYNGYYTADSDVRMHVPRNMLPPRGMCRVWIPNRALSSQPRIESCDGIRSRVPSGAYVVYGG